MGQFAQFLEDAGPGVVTNKLKVAKLGQLVK